MVCYDRSAAAMISADQLLAQDPAQDTMRHGVRWELLHGGGIAFLTRLLRSNSKALISLAYSCPRCPRGSCLPGCPCCPARPALFPSGSAGGSR